MSRVPWERYPDDVEPVVAILLSRRFPSAVRIRPSQGDGGIDILVPVDDTPYFDVYQVKRFASNLTSNQKDQIKASYERLLQTIRAEGLLIRAWHLTLPLDPTPPNRIWLNELTHGASFKSEWRGLNFIEGLASDYPAVIDYYLNDGADRLARVVEQFVGLLRHRDASQSQDRGLSPKDVDADLRNMYDALNEHDPHYSYSFRVDDRPVPVMDEPRLVAAHQTLTDGVCVTHYIYARYNEAPFDRPITTKIHITADPESTLGEELESFHKYGTPLVAPAAITVELPAGLSETITEGQVRMTPFGLSEPHVLRLQIVDEDRSELALVRVNMQPATKGIVGHGIRGYGREENGVFDFEIRLDLQTRLAKVHFSRLDLKGISPVAALVGLRFLEACRVPNAMRVGLAYGPLNDIPVPFPDAAEAIDVTFSIHAADALAKLQDHTGVQLALPDLATIRVEDIVQWRQAGALLSGETIEMSWNSVEMSIPSENLAMLDANEGVQLGAEGPLDVAIGDQTVTFGTQRTVVVAAQLDPEHGVVPEGERVRVRLVPASHTDQMFISLVPAAEAAEPR